MMNAAALLVPGTVSFAGIVLAEENDEPLPNATLHVMRNGRMVGTTTNLDGIYTFDGIPGEMVTLRYVGRETETFEVPREVDALYTHRLASNAQLAEFEVFGDKPDPDGQPQQAGGNLGVLALLAAGVGLLLLANNNEDRRK